MQRETVIIGDKEYAMSKINAFAANGLILKIQKIALPIMGEAANGKGLDMDLKELAELISGKLDETVMAEIVMPMFKLSQVASVTDSIKLDSQQAIDKAFTVDDLADFYELIFLVLKFNFEKAFTALVARFGVSVGAPANQN